jgi:hypothetical protein
MKYKEDDRAARGLWAPGMYLNRCDTCRDLFVGAKLCMRCADCAYAPSPQDTVEKCEWPHSADTALWALRLFYP